MTDENRMKLNQAIHAIIALEQLKFLLEVPSLTYEEWEALGCGIQDRLLDNAVGEIHTSAVEIVREACLYGQETRIERRVEYPDGRVEETVEIERSAPNTDLLLEVFSRFTPDIFVENATAVAAWVASGQNEPPQSLVAAFDAIFKPNTKSETSC